MALDVLGHADRRKGRGNSAVPRNEAVSIWLVATESPYTGRTCVHHLCVLLLYKHRSAALPSCWHLCSECAASHGVTRVMPQRKPACHRPCSCQAAVEGNSGPRSVTVCLILGETLWNHSSSFSRNASILSPLLQVPDVDSDGAPDLLVFTQEQEEVQPSLAFLPSHQGHLPHGRPLPPHLLPLPRQDLGLTTCRGLSQSPTFPTPIDPAY